MATRNVLLDENLVPKIADLGMSRTDQGEENVTGSAVGPIRWMAPASLIEQVYNRAGDVWSFGVILYEIFAR